MNMVYLVSGLNGIGEAVKAEVVGDNESINELCYRKAELLGLSDYNQEFLELTYEN